MRILVILAVLLAPSLVCAQGGWRLETASALWDVRKYHNVIEFSGKLWVFHGSEGVAGPQKDAWSTSDGVIWVQEVSVLPWSSRTGAAMVVFDNRLWTLGGIGGDYENDVWSSPDGVNWTEEVANAPWLGRMYHSVVVFNGRMWLLGGLTFQSPTYFTLNDVWSSADGVNWTQEVAAAAWSSRSGHTVEVFKNKMWLMGGWNLALEPNKNDVWSSTDGVNWTPEVSSAPWAGRAAHNTVVFNDRIWIIGGLQVDALDDVWSSSDGLAWQQEITHAPFGARDGHSSAVFNDRIWVLGGAVDTYMNDVWSYGLHLTAGNQQGQNVVLPRGLLEVPYAAPLWAKEGTGPYTWNLTGGSLPPGLSLATSTTDSIAITGTPTALGTFTFTVKVTDGTANFDEQVVSLTITKINQAGTGTSPGCAAAPNGLPAAPLAATAAMALFALTPRRRRALNKPA